MTNPTALSQAVTLVAGFEGCRLEAYQDIVGVWTVGYGETQDVHKGDVWTQQEADEQLSLRLEGFMARVVAACPQLAQEDPSKLAACTSLAYNIGLAGFESSTVCRQTIAKNYQAAGDAFLLWDKAGGKFVQGLLNRRQAERKVYLGE